MLQNNLAVGIDDKADVEEAVRPILMARLGLRHDVDVPLFGELADLVGLRAGNVDAAGARVVGVVDVEHFVVEPHQRAFGDREQLYGNVEIGQPERRLGQTLDVLDIVLDVVAAADAVEGRNETDGIIGFDHRVTPLRIRIIQRRRIILTSLTDVGAHEGRPCDAARVGAALVAALPSLRRDAWQTCQRHGEFTFIVFVVDQLAFEIADVGPHIEMAVAREIEQNGL